MTGVDIVSRFGASVRNLRRRRGISQEALAERADLHRTYLAGIEGGARNVTLRVVEKLARALQVSAATLLATSAERVDDGANLAPSSPAQEFVDILLVEDNPDDVELTLYAFKKARFANTVQVVRDGQEAVDYLFCRGAYAHRRVEDRPKLMLLDLDLPNVSGLEVLQRIKADKRTEVVPVVVLTASHKSRDIAECRRLGAMSYIVKPVDFCRLSAVTPELSLNWGLFRDPLALRG
jgi:CheY-like chemotaxis protein/DNA-binding XRE family transcriptional regulator